MLYLAFDDANKHVLIESLGVISGPSYELLNALRASFRNARERELRPELYPFVKTIELAHMLTLEEGCLRKRVYRFRNEDIPDLCRARRGARSA